MRKFLRYADAITLACGTLGMLLQFWIIWSGTDDKGLYPARHPGWILSWVLTLAVVVFLWLLTRQAGNNHSFQSNFPASPIAAIGCAVAGVALLITAPRMLATPQLLDRLAGLVAIAAGLGLLLAGLCRFRGAKPPFICYALPCLFYALHIFCLGRDVGGEPETVRYLFRYLANLAMIPACYQLWGFSVNLGNRQKSMFWSLLAGFLSILSSPGESGSLLYLASGFWMLSASCILMYLPRRIRTMPQPEPEPEMPSTAPEIPATMQDDFFPFPESAPQPESQIPESPAPASQADAELDPEAIIAQILQQIDSNIQ